MSVSTKYITTNVLIPIFGNKFEYEVKSYYPFDSTTYINLKDPNNHQIQVSMYITQEVLHISSLKKTKHSSGSLLLENIKSLALQFNVPEITLYDDSSIDYGVYESEIHDYELTIDLYLLHILLYGESWYNKHGFYMKNGNAHMEYSDHNKKLLQMSMGDLLQIYIRKCNDICRNCLLNPSCVNYAYSHAGAMKNMQEFVLHYYYANPKSSSYLENISEMDLETILDTISVNEFMTAFKKQKLLKNDMSYMTVYLIHLINFIGVLHYYDEDGNEGEPLLKYNNELTSVPLYSVEGELVMP